MARQLQLLISIITLVCLSLLMVCISSSQFAFAQGAAGGPIPGSAGTTQTPRGPVGGPIPNGAVTYDNVNSGGGGVGGGERAEATLENSQTLAPQETPATTLGNGLYDFLYAFVITVFGSIFAWSGALMSYGIDQFLLGFGNQYYNKNVGVAVESTWALIRDLFNLTFIFGLVYIGFKMILDSSDSKARSMLVSLIGAALLVNFSLFITKFIIDIANVAALVISRGFNGQDIANSFINLLNLNTILTVSAEQVVNMGSGGAFAYIFGIMIFLAVASFVFAAAGILLIVRFVVLNIYLVFSPVMFIGWVFPSMQQYSTKFWSGFLGNAFFAPAYLLMIYMSFQVLSRYGDVIGNANYAALFAVAKDPNQALGMVNIIPFFVLAMVFMVASLVVAKNMGAVGASTAVSIGNKWRGSVQNAMQTAALAPARYAARTVVGSHAADFERYNDRLQGSKTGRAFKRAVSIVSLGTFTERERRAAIAAGKNAKFGGTYSYADDVKFKKEVLDTSAEQKEKQENKKKIRAGLEARETAEHLRTDAQHIAMQEFSSVVSKMGVSDIEKMDEKTRLAVAPLLTHGLMEKLKDSHELTEDQKYAVKKARKDMVMKNITEGADVVTAELVKLTIEQLEELGDEFVLKHVDLLAGSQMDDLKKSKKFNEYQRNRFTTVRSTKQSAVGTPVDQYFTQTKRSTNDVDKTAKRKASEVASLGKDVLTRKESLDYLNADILEAIADKKTLGVEDRRKVKVEIMNLSSSDSRVKSMQDWLDSPQGQRTWGS